MAIHAYTIVDAINDKNVLPFRIDYVNTIKLPEDLSRQAGVRHRHRAGAAGTRAAAARWSATHSSTSTRRPSASAALLARRQASQWLQRSVRHGLDRRRQALLHRVQGATEGPDVRISGSRSASSSRYAANEDVGDDYLDEEGFETSSLDQSSRDFLDAAIQDYNAIFGTSFDTSADKFQNYYKDLSERLKNREIDLVIVVNMFLTGFDATTLNTLFVDKRLVNHGLIQAYSRTNRILNSVKTYGNIVSFRDLEEETNEAIALFGNKDARGIVLLKPYGDYYAEYADRAHELLAKFPLGEPIIGEAAQKEFIALFGADPAPGEHPDRVRRVRRQRDPHRAPEPGLPQRLPRPLRRVPQGDDRREGVDQRRHRLRDRAHQAGRDQRRLHPDARPEVARDPRRRLRQGNRGRREDPARRRLQPDPAQQEGPHHGLRRSCLRRRRDRRRVARLSSRPSARPNSTRSSPRKSLKPEETKAFIDHAFRDGSIPITGTAITRILPPVSRFSADGGHGEKKQRVLARLGCSSIGSLGSSRGEHSAGKASVNRYGRSMSEPVITRVAGVEDLPPGSRATRRVVAAWSDGTESEALAWFGDEWLVSEGDFVGLIRHSWTLY